MSSDTEQDRVFVYGDLPQPQLVTPGAAPTDHSGPSASILDRIKSVSQATLEADVRRWPVPARPGFEVGYSTYLPKARMEMFRQAHTDDFDGYQRAILLTQCREIVVDGEVWLEDGKTGTFRSPSLWEMLEATDAFGAIDEMYLRDPDIARTASAVLAASGWDLTQPLDPTQP